MELLSGGQKPRMAFALLSLQRPHIFIILDEPPDHLDVEAKGALIPALSELEGGVLMVSHDVTMLRTAYKHL